MNPVRPSGAVKHAQGADPFEASFYAEWVRRAVRLRETQPQLSILFESTVSEPGAALAEVVRAAFTEPVTSRFVSAFADGNPFARRALAARYEVGEHQLIMTTGATSALRIVLDALVGPGDEVLVEQPGFDVLPRTAEASGARVRPLRRPAPDFRLDLADLKAKLTPRTRAVLVTNLHNPSGAQLSGDEIAEAADLLAAKGALLVVDEVYADFAGDAARRPAARFGQNVVSLSSLTKVFGLFALKFGWIAADPEVLARIQASAPDGDMGVSKLAHALAAHVLEQPEPFEAHWRDVLSHARPALLRAAGKMRQAGLLEGEPPEYGCMYFPRVVGVDDTVALARWLLREHQVLVAPGEYFGAPGHVRIGFGGAEATLEEGLQRLEQGLRRYGR